jgi:hypothetical protein
VSDCPACAILSDQVAWLRKQNEVLQAQIVSLADPMAMARVNVTSNRNSGPPAEPRKQPILSSKVAATRELDRLTPEQKEQIDAAEAEVAPALDVRAEIERSFEKPEA